EQRPRPAGHRSWNGKEKRCVAKENCLLRLTKWLNGSCPRQSGIWKRPLKIEAAGGIQVEVAPGEVCGIHRIMCIVTVAGIFRAYIIVLLHICLKIFNIYF
ncbi:hypothetical protein M5D96_004827, partial [Drosophila gunungcola]